MKKIALLILLILFSLASYIVYKNLEVLNPPPKFTVINSTKSSISFKAKWKESQISVDNLIGEMTFTTQAEASMIFTIKYETGKTDVKTIGYFTSGSRFQIKIEEDVVVVSGH